MNDNSSTNGKPGEFTAGPASKSQVSLSQALLAPLDAIFKAQVHAARSFLSLILQLGYKHQKLKEDGSPEKEGGDTPYMLDFPHEIEVDGERKRQVIRVPALSVIPISPLAVKEGEFKFTMSVKHIERHSQMQKSKSEDVKKDLGLSRHDRPWYLVDDPISVRGTFAPRDISPEESGVSREATIDIAVRVGAIKMPAGLDRFLSSLNQISEVVDEKTKSDDRNF